MRKIYFYFSFFIIFTFIVGCEKEEPLALKKEQSNSIKTVPIEDAIAGLPQAFVDKKGKQAQTYVIPRFEDRFYGSITNTEEKILVIPADHKNPSVQSSILILEVNGIIRNVVLNLYPEQNQESSLFSGEIGLFDLKGEFQDGYRVKNGHMTSRFIKTGSINKTVSDGVCQEHGNCYDSSICIHCEQSLDEVLITTPPPDQPTTIDVPTLYPGDEPGGDGQIPEWAMILDPAVEPLPVQRMRRRRLRL